MGGESQKEKEIHKLEGGVRKKGPMEGRKSSRLVVLGGKFGGKKNETHRGRV